MADDAAAITMSMTERRRTQNRMAQRRFRQRHNQSTTLSDQGAQSRPIPTISSQPAANAYVSHNDIVSNERPVQGAHPSQSELPLVPHKFGSGCLLGLNGGMPGVQNAPDMSRLEDFTAEEMLFMVSGVLGSPDDWASEEMDSRLLLSSAGSSSLTSSAANSVAMGSVGSVGCEKCLASCDLAATGIPRSNGSPASSSAGFSSSSPHLVTTSSTQITESTEEHQGSGWALPLHIAARKGHHRVVQILLQGYSDCNEVDSDGITPLIHATIGGHDDVVVSLLSHGAELKKVDCQSRSALHWAVVHKQETLLKILLDHCCGDQELLNGYDEDGRTPVHVAADTGFEAGMQALLESGADIHYRTRRRLS